MKTILVAGASGFIGKALLEELLKNEEYKVIALSRRDKESNHPRLEWKKCDLYSLKDVKEAMTGCEVAYYLVHSMLPSAGLTQGKFYDFDLIMADNFVRAIEVSVIKRVVYLGGLLPQDKTDLSWHLRSRLEVEKTLRAAKSEVVVLRAGLIIGKDGSSFFILKRLVERLPLMILPSWTKTRMEPIALPDVIRVLSKSLTLPSTFGNRFDIGGKERISYRDLILRAAKIMHKKIPTFSYDFISIRLSRFWVSLITGADKSLVYPLVLSLKHEMLASPDRAWPFPEDIQVNLDESLKEAMADQSVAKPAAKVHFEKDVRSVQRLTLPPGKNAEWVSQEYFHWLPRYMRPFFQIKTEGNWLRIRLIVFPIYLLILEKSPERSSPDRQLMYIRGGILARKIGRGRLEFREVLEKKYIMAAIHEFRPTLPWFIYRLTQAPIHIWVMHAFGRHLKKFGRQ